MNHRTCTAIVCAYNEEKTLAGVLYALIDSPQIDKIVVVDDGSSDGTPGILRSFEGRDDVLPIRLSENKGKGYAMAEGISIARGELLLFVDGDLLNLTSHFIEQVLHPIHNGEADMVIGYPVRGEGWAWRINPLRPLSGERALFRTDILPLLDAIRESRFGVETLINLHYCKEGKRIRHVPLQGLIHPIKLLTIRMKIDELCQSIASSHPYLKAISGLLINNPTGAILITPPQPFLSLIGLSIVPIIPDSREERQVFPGALKR